MSFNHCTNSFYCLFFIITCLMSYCIYSTYVVANKVLLTYLLTSRTSKGRLTPNIRVTSRHVRHVHVILFSFTLYMNKFPNIYKDTIINSFHDKCFDFWVV